MKIRQIMEKIFSKREKVSEIKPMGVTTTVPRPEMPVNRLSEEERNLMMQNYKKQKEEDEKLDSYFIQEISDRLYGPDSDEYVSALKQLNQNYRARKGRTGSVIYRDEI